MSLTDEISRFMLAEAVFAYKLVGVIALVTRTDQRARGIGGIDGCGGQQMLGCP